MIFLILQKRETMTRQIRDSIIPNENDDRSYSVRYYEGGRPFKFSDYFKEPFIFFTACWHRHVAHYKIVNNDLILDNLRVFKDTDTAPTINGVKPEFIEFFDSRIPVYRNLGMKMEYTGRIMVHSGYLSLGLRPIFEDVQVKNIYEYKFISGNLEQQKDLSWLTEQFRKELLEYAIEHCETDEMMNKLLGHAIRNKKNISEVKEMMKEAKEMILSGNLGKLPKSFNYPLFVNFKLKDREFHKEFTKRLYQNYGFNGYDW
jgi:hypothetical protein